MRLWTLHPKYLDPAGLVALWREGLLAQQVLRGGTRGYRHHPQLERFRYHARPRACLTAYLRAVYEEARTRGYRFDGAKLARRREVGVLKETRGQLQYEWKHLKRKLRRRSPGRYRRLQAVTRPDPHPLFEIVAGGIRGWEKAPLPGQTGRRSASAAHRS
jgi:hypothetical protein